MLTYYYYYYLFIKTPTSEGNILYCIIHTYKRITDITRNITVYVLKGVNYLVKICAVEFLFRKSALYNTPCDESTTPFLAEYFSIYLNVESAERRGNRPMSSSLPKSVFLLYFPVNKYLDIKNEHRLHTGEFTKHILFIRFTGIDLILSSIGKIPTWSDESTYSDQEKL